MKAVARLVWIYFTGSLTQRLCTLGGLALCGVAAALGLYATNKPILTLFAVAGQIALFVGSSMMPLVFGRLAQSHGGHLLPLARWKLLLSAAITLALVALPAALLTPWPSSPARAVLSPS